MIKMNPNQSPAEGVPFPCVPAVIFAHRREAFNQASLPDKVRNGYTVAINGYLDYCRHNGISVTTESARHTWRMRSIVN